MPVEELPYWVRVVQALGPVIVAVIAAFIAGLIAYRQWRTAHDKIRFDLYGKRMDVYNLILDYFNNVIPKGTLDEKDFIKIYKAKAESQFIFGPDILDYIQLLISDGIKIFEAHDNISNADAPKRSENISIKYDTLKILSGHQKNLKKTFSTYLSFEKYKS